MNARISWLAAGMFACGLPSAAAQLPTTVQLPSYSVHAVSTTVSAPDRGSIGLSGFGGSSLGSTAFGPSFGPRSRGFGRQTSASRTSVHATVHDFDALDRQSLDRARRSYGSATGRSGRSAYGDTSSAAQAPAGSVAEARRLHAVELAAAENEALKYLNQAERAAARGKPQVASVLYQMAERRATGELKAKIRSRLAALKLAASEHAAAPKPPATSAKVSAR